MTEVNVSLDEVFERIDDAFFALDHQWRFTYLNDRAEEFLDVDRAAVVGEVVWDEFEPAVGTTFQAEYERAMETQEPVAFEEHYPPLDTWFEVNAYPSETGLSVYFRDVTDRVERERELERYEALVGAVQDGIYVVDDDGRFTMVNDAYAEMLGYDRAELVGAPVSLVVDDETAADARALEAELESESRGRASMEATLHRADGSTLEAEATFALIPGGERVGVVRDITERKERERRLEQYERIVETVDDGVYAVDDDAEFLLVNDAFCELTGYDRAGLLGEHASMVYDDAIAPEADRLASEVASGDREEAVLEFALHTRDGERVPIESRFDPFPLEDGAGRCGVVRDISERKEREAALRRQHERLSALNDINSLVHGLSESMFELSTRSEIEQLVCDRLTESVSYESAWVGTVDEDGEVVVSTEAQGGPDGVLVAAGSGAQRRTTRVHRTGEPQVVRAGEGDPTAVGYRSSVAIPIAADGEVRGALNVHSERSDAFSAEERDALRRLGAIIAHAISSVERDRELQRERNRLEFTNSLLRHNLLNSLNVVEARLRLVQGRADDAVSEHLDTAIDRANDMIEFVETFREVTKVISRNEKQELRPVDLGEVLAARVERARNTYEGEYHIESVPNVDVLADDLLGEVLDNVLVNAVQHNHRETPRVWVDVAVGDSEVVVSVADDGPGLDDEQKAELFERESEGFDPGTGFGLYLVEEVLDTYGGTITVEDNDPEGSVFRLTFRRARREASRASTE